jgi:hypothetical protein
VLHDVLEVLVAGKAGQLVGNDLLPLSGDHLGGIPGSHARPDRLVDDLGEEGAIGLRPLVLVESHAGWVRKVVWVGERASVVDDGWSDQRMTGKVLQEASR